MKGLVHFLQFVPLPDEVLDFFKPVARQILQLLKGLAFLPTLNSGTHTDSLTHSRSHTHNCLACSNSASPKCGAQ